MAVRKVQKEDLHKLIDQLEEKDNQSIYELLQKVINKTVIIEDGVIVEYDDFPLTEAEKKAVEKTEMEIKDGEYVEWSELKNELGI